MDASEFTIKFSALQRELDSAIEADQKYQRENNAKFRALDQRVGSYEEFRDIVLASHLKPLDKKDKADATRKQTWNSLACSSEEQEWKTCESLEARITDFHPKTASEFIRDWRRLEASVTEKFNILLSLGGDVLCTIFSTEIGFGLLGDFMLILNQAFQFEDYKTVAGVLQGLSRTSRFSLNLSLLSQTEEAACKELFQKLQDSRNSGVNKGDNLVDETVGEDSSADELDYLMNVYGVQADCS
ncbi:dynein axonemal assembly factor 19 [Denticeps clupeoides]|uniref:dynein axonemal assembly factor 19 n=1 Tax=Denticeps clupeoides TaxID=299321 RepID=UPI0010A51BD1|nr:coiled-coil domain-containing protein 103 [Denticeps clupeoides]